MAEELAGKAPDKAGDDEYEIVSSHSLTQLAEPIIGGAVNRDDNYTRTTNQRIGTKVKEKSKPKRKSSKKKEPWEIEKEKKAAQAAARRSKKPQEKQGSKTEKKVQTRSKSRSKQPPLKKMNSEEEEKLMVDTLKNKTQLSENAVSLSKDRPLGRFFQRVAMSVYLSPFHVIF